MKRRVTDREAGAGNGSMILIICLALVALALGGGFGWAYVQWNNTKAEQEAVVAEAVATAKEEQKVASEAEFREQIETANESPYLTWTAPELFAGVTFQYPRNWAAYYVEDGVRDRTNYFVVFNPTVIATYDANTQYAMRVIIATRDYDTYLAGFQSNVNLTITPVTFDGVTGVRIDGQINRFIEGTRYVFPIRNQTVTIATDRVDNRDELDSIIMSSLQMNQ